MVYLLRELTLKSMLWLHAELVIIYIYLLLNRTYTPPFDAKSVHQVLKMYQYINWAITIINMRSFDNYCQQDSLIVADTHSNYPQLYK